MTDMNETHGVILKTDRRGRLRYSPEQKQAMIEAFESSGLSAPRFAALHGVNYQTLVYWIKKRRGDSEDHPALRSLVPAVIDPPSPGSSPEGAVEILLPGGVRLFVHTSRQMDLAIDLVRKLNSGLPC